MMAYLLDHLGAILLWDVALGVLLGIAAVLLLRRFIPTLLRKGYPMDRGDIVTCCTLVLMCFIPVVNVLVMALALVASLLLLSMAADVYVFKRRWYPATS
jgi:hypothetical protein